MKMCRPKGLLYVFLIIILYYFDAGTLTFFIGAEKDITLRITIKISANHELLSSIMFELIVSVFILCSCTEYSTQAS